MGQPSSLTRQAQRGAISLSPSPTSGNGFSPAPSSSPRHTRASPPPSAVGRLTPSRTALLGSASVVGFQRKSLPARSVSPDSVLEFDESGRPLSSILSV